MHIYVDDTQLVHWQGFLAGIPRVMYELGKRFESTADQRVSHVSWVKEIRGFVRIDFNATMQRDRGIVYRDNAATPITGATTTAAVSRSYRSEVIQVSKKIARRFGVDDSRPVRYLKAKISADVTAKLTLIAPVAGDVVVITWGEWWDKNFLAVLEKWASEGVHIIPVIHDVLPFTQAPHFSGHSTDSLMDFCRRVVPVSSVVLCVSEATKRDLSQWLTAQNIDLPSIAVFRLGEDFEFATAQQPLDPTFLGSGLRGDDYSLTVGTLEARKNHTLLYYVHKLAKKRGIELPKAVIVGRRGWKTEQIYDFMRDDPEVKDMFVFMHNTSNEELSWLYDHALYSVFPSMYEGWGMPIAESVARGVPCICSNTTSMIEIAEDYVLHFSPYSTDECLNAMVKLQDARELAKLRTRTKQYKQTTWDQSYTQVRSIMKEIINV